MNATSRLRRAGTLTLIVWAFRSVSALLCLWPFGKALSSAPTSLIHVAALDRATLATLLDFVLSHGPQLLLWIGTCTLLYAVLSPLLTLAWLHAMARTDDARASLRRGFSDYRTGLGLLVVAAFAYIALAAFTALAFAYCVRLTHSALAEDSLRLGIGSLALFGVLGIATAHDLSLAACVSRTSGIMMALRTGIDGVSTRMLASHALLCIASAAIAIGADATSRIDSTWIGPTASFALQQTLVLGTVWLRGLWLALALQHTAIRRES